MRIDHIGYAVKNINKAKKAMETLGYTFDETIDDIDRNIQIAFGYLDGYRIELVAPMDRESPVGMILARVGPTPYHVCYKSVALLDDIHNLEQNRFKVQIPPAPAVAFGGKSVVFMYSLAVGLIEIVEE